MRKQVPGFPLLVILPVSFVIKTDTNCMTIIIMHLWAYIILFRDNTKYLSFLSKAALPCGRTNCAIVNITITYKIEFHVIRISRKYQCRSRSKFSSSKWIFYDSVFEAGLFSYFILHSNSFHLWSSRTPPVTPPAKARRVRVKVLY